MHSVRQPSVFSKLPNSSCHKHLLWVEVYSRRCQWGFLPPSSCSSPHPPIYSERCSASDLRNDDNTLGILPTATPTSPCLLHPSGLFPNLFGLSVGPRNLSINPLLQPLGPLSFRSPSCIPDTSCGECPFLPPMYWSSVPVPCCSKSLNVAFRGDLTREYPFQALHGSWFPSLFH